MSQALEIDLIGGIDGEVDPTAEYLRRDPRNPTYPFGSGGTVNYGLRVDEDPLNTVSRPRLFPREAEVVLTELDKRLIGDREKNRYAGIPVVLQGDDGLSNTDFFSSRLALGEEDGLYGNKKIEFKMLKAIDMSSAIPGYPSPIMDIEGLGAVDIGSDGVDRLYDIGLELGRLGIESNEDISSIRLSDIDGIVDEFMMLFFTPFFDGVSISAIKRQLGPKVSGLLGLDELGALPKIKLPKLPNLKKVGEGIKSGIKKMAEVPKVAVKVAGKVVQKTGAAVAKAATAVVSKLSEAYKAIADKMNILKPKKTKVVAEMNQIKGQLASIEKKGLQSPKSKAKYATLKKDYDALAKESAKVLKEGEKLEQGEKQLKAESAVKGVEVGVKCANYAKAQGVGTTGTANAGKLAFVGFGNIGAVPVAAVAVITVGAVVAAIVICDKILKGTGKLKQETHQAEIDINKYESEYKLAAELPPDSIPPGAPFQEPIVDVNTGEQIGMRVGNQVLMKKEAGETEKRKVINTAIQQSGAATSAAGQTGFPATIAQQQDTLTGKLGIPTWAMVAAGAVGIAVIYFAITSRSKKTEAS